ncbi:MAG: DHH family phosphoesterase [Candidatus Dormibacteria bacterium]
MSLSPEEGAIGRLLDEYQRVLVMCHRDPDGDAVGAALALSLSLREAGRQVATLVPQPMMPAMWDWLPGWDQVSTRVPDPPFLACVVDSADRRRVGEAEALLDRADAVVNIDHHGSNPGFGDVNLVRPQAAATCEIVFELLRRLDLPVTAAVAWNLYCGIFSDTGGYRHDNTNAQVLALGAELSHLGADVATIAEKLYKSRPRRAFRLETRVLAEHHFEEDNQVLWTTLTREMMDDLEATTADAEGVIDSLSSVEGVKIALFFKDRRSGEIKVSIRTRDPHDAAAIASHFGGGGHERAAGCEVHRPRDEAVQLVLQAARAELARHRGR